MFLASLLQSNVAKAAAATTTLAAAKSAVTAGVIEVPGWVYTIIAVFLSLLGVFLARMVTIGNENKKLGRVQTWRETGPLTWIGVLIVAPLIWHFNVAVPWASMIGLGVGYSVRVMLVIFGGGAVAATRAMLRGAVAALDEKDSLSDAPLPEGEHADPRLLRHLDRLPPTPIPTPPESA